MQKMLCFSALAVILFSCNPVGKDDAKTDVTQTAAADGEKISEIRTNPAAAPVANYVKKVNNDLNEWYFRVQLYETHKRFVYHLVMEYETIKEERDITLPNLNEEPKSAIRPGSREYDAIIGFDDNKGEFKEYLNVFVEDGNLRLKTLKHYAVTEKEVQ